jgi:hypothetical protein
MNLYRETLVKRVEIENTVDFAGATAILVVL